MGAHTHSDEAMYRPSDEEREAIIAALDAAHTEPEEISV